MENATSFTFDDFIGMQKFMVEPVATWSTNEMLLFPWLFIIPAEILGGISTTMIALFGASPWGLGLLGDKDLPHGRMTAKPLGALAWFYIYFNRLVLLPFLSWMIVGCVWNSPAIVYDAEKLDWINGLVGFLVVFSLSDLSYYTMHRVVHTFPTVYKFVHKHHHGEAEPIRGWADTCNAHPTDFFYTGFCTSPLSCLWLMPMIGLDVHIYSIAACLWVNSFVGSLGHCRLDLNIGVFNTRFHAGHHGNSSCNFAQNIEIWDRIFGTYKDYSAVVDRKNAEKAK
jgi:sterol desaturase/sphingolipid hydroxylase (fatty acid hydroxylase superfamily)